MGALVSLLLFVVIVVVAISTSIGNRVREKERLLKVAAKYQGELAEKIRNQMIWTGQTAEQLKDSLGDPSAIDKQQLKTRSREIWKYAPDGANRYRLRITLDDGQVASWTKRN